MILWVFLSWLGILFPVIFTYVHPQLQDTVATSVVYTKTRRHHVPEKFSQRCQWLPLAAQWGLLSHWDLRALDDILANYSDIPRGATARKHEPDRPRGMSRISMIAVGELNCYINLLRHCQRGLW
jgi:hypothetical protein